MIGLAAIAARWAARLGGAAILVAAVLVAAEVLSRNLGLGLRLHAFELTNYIFAAAVAFGLSWALVEGAHIRIDLLYRWLPMPLRAVLDVAALAALAVTAAGMAWQGWRVTGASLALGARPNATLDIPLALPQAVWAAGLSWFAAVAALMALAALARLIRGRWAEISRMAGIDATGGPR
ncbi:MAG: hypothetical protein KatS3mg118_1022 [Paracoccaceae bacterium]|nr:MAG: hypothetical protein KatS3mg118_1022 [Paracoccaceae bacterium]